MFNATNWVPNVRRWHAPPASSIRNAFTVATALLVYARPTMDGISPTGGLSAALQSASAAINRAVSSVNRDAAVVASSTIADPRELLPALIDSRQQLLYTQAAAKLISAADQMLGTLIDVRA